MEARRSERVAEVLRDELGEIINYELDDPRITAAAVTEVFFPPGARQVHVRLTIQGTAEEQASCLEAIQKARGFIKIQLAERIDMFRMPDIKFFADLDPETRRKQSEILRRIRRGRPRPDVDPPEKKAGS
ncbi:MAG TPA: 30S ribosome-binding factor RbfA [Bryobacteraceae bacterium]|jgi:ribosome-binding factor A|nr:30S ribosome-binding factor RbfA [Bryobacteraceae bacterium]